MSLLTFFKLPMQFLVSRIPRLSLLLLPLCLIMTNADAAILYPKEFRIGYQKGNSLVILKASGVLEKVLAPYGVNVKWFEFPFGPPMIEALNAGDIDFGYVGSTPPVLAQAGGAPEIRYVGYTGAYQDNYAIVVPQGSNAHSLRDLQGKKIAVAKGSAGQYLLLKAFEQEGLKTDEVNVAYLQYSEARSAFERGDVAAWVLPDPRLADIEQSIGARPLITASKLPLQYSFYVAPVKFASAYPTLLRITLELLNDTEQRAKEHIDETAGFLEKDTRVAQKIWQLALRRQAWGVFYPLTPAIIDAQQDVANTFWRYKLIPKAVQVRDATVSVK
ncbi:sulfonate transport system substrate-binding protein [Herbaspirillum sp. Sphag1AN]|uniref:aliphatic sulfonate ABC transporter substrate-binding protein n=1 Tax=unclassified Herbaspirillum TaxID=2624150 RepID=UPI0016149829|nr:MULTISPECIES: aliphatic sulfonate ABC transporter substrate-binding protein [unclassified Herbaspirillum]MBB3212051.1 sulfonate transport system substrate-binding protein [Herbaspirillum sp. Sphag1AN]MBB3244115.1 sulfonate transport system substrate-binding protein [Herbaspirillum sp. Sphag64]